MSRHYYRWHDVAIASDIPLSLPSAPCGHSGLTALRFVCDPDLGRPQSPSLMRSPTTGFDLHADPPGACWLVRDDVRIHLGSAQIRIWARALDSILRDYLSTRVLALWLHLIERPPVHASALALTDRAIALMGRSGAGKSTLAAALARRGHAVLGDDLLPLYELDGQFMAAPGQPSLRLWNDSAAHFHSAPDALPRVTPDTDKRQLPAASHEGVKPVPLAALLVLDRQLAGTDEPALTAMDPGALILRMLANGQMAGPAEALGLGAMRLRVFSEAARRVPGYRLRYPSDHAALDQVCGLIERQLELGAAMPA